MQVLPENDTVDFVEMAADIVSAYVSNNSIRPADLGELITSVHQTLSSLGTPTEPAAENVEKATPVQIKKSITPEGLISFMDGKRYKTLKRHLTTHGLSPESYRVRFGLPHDYPMVASDYAAQRSALAKSIGLGRVSAEVPAAPAEEVVKAEPKRRGRPSKAA